MTTTPGNEALAQALADEINARITARKAEATERAQARRALRVQLAGRRAFGLAARHAIKVARTEGDPSDHPLNHLKGQITVGTTTTAPHVGLCTGCEQDVRLRANGATVKHKAPDGPTCPGSGQQGAPLPLTFRRWLNTQIHRRGHGPDLYIGRLARYAVRAYVLDQWVTADELADVMGRAGIRPDRDLVYYLAVAAEEYEALLASSTTAP